MTAPKNNNNSSSSNSESNEQSQRPYDGFGTDENRAVYEKVEERFREENDKSIEEGKGPLYNSEPY